MARIKYIEVIFGDNDFGWPIERALKRLWKFINENNRHLVPDTYISNIYTNLHKARALQTLIERLYVLEYIASDVEFKTRGLYSDYIEARYKKKGEWKARVKWKEAFVKNAGKLDYENKYLIIDVRLHTKKNFTNKWHNGEHAFLNILTGEVATY